MPGYFRWLISAVLITAMGYIFLEWNNVMGFFVVLFMAVLLIATWTSFFILEIEKDGKFTEYIMSLGNKWGKKTQNGGAFSHVFINSSGYSQTQYGYGVNAYKKEGREYRAYLKFANGQKLFLISDENLPALEEKIQPLVKKLKVEVTTPS